MKEATNNKKKIYFVTGGGTGGHIYPAVAVGNALQKEADTEKIYYVGNPNNLEKKIADDKIFEFLSVDITGMPRTMSWDFIVWGAKLLCATVKSVSYIFKYKPSLIFGTGGYVSAPMLLAGILTKTPVVIHECDAVAGKVTKLIAPYANSVSIAFEHAREGLNAKEIFYNGNPVREEFSSTDRYKVRKEWNLKDKLWLWVVRKVRKKLIQYWQEV